MDEKHIISLLQKRNESALTMIQRAFGPRLHSLARNILGSEEDARECVNDTLLALWNAIPPANPSPLSAYIMRVCKNKALSRLRDAGAAKRSGYNLSLEELGECIGFDSLERTMDMKLLGQAIDRFLDTLPRRDRALFLRRFWFGDSVSELASHFGMRENAVSVRLNRIKAKLRTYLLKEGLYEHR